MLDLKVLRWRSKAETQGWTAWSEDLLGHKKNGWCQHVLFPGIGAGPPAEGS